MESLKIYAYSYWNNYENATVSISQIPENETCFWQTILFSEVIVYRERWLRIFRAVAATYIKFFLELS